MTIYCTPSVHNCSKSRLRVRFRFLVHYNNLAKSYTMAKDEQLYLKIQDVLLTNLDEVSNSRFQIDDVHHQGRAMLQGIS